MWFYIPEGVPTPPLKRVDKNWGRRPEIGDFWHGFAAFRIAGRRRSTRAHSLRHSPAKMAAYCCAAGFLAFLARRNSEVGNPGVWVSLGSLAGPGLEPPRRQDVRTARHLASTPLFCNTLGQRGGLVTAFFLHHQQLAVGPHEEGAPHEGRLRRAPTNAKLSATSEAPLNS